ncbi:hypothetical protein I7I48_05720 [Histoplasma ohiense]|nr:hypothetical protein I7I48_05720 [Histoplasma ohiense (nom. inval.)]
MRAFDPWNAVRAAKPFLQAASSRQRQRVRVACSRNASQCSWSLAILLFGIWLLRADDGVLHAETDAVWVLDSKSWRQCAPPQVRQRILGITRNTRYQVYPGLVFRCNSVFSDLT